MRRGELRGYEWAGVRVAVEVPEDVDPERDWALPDGWMPIPDGPLREHVRISCDVRAHTFAGREGTTWFHEGDVFESGRVGADHWIRSGDDGRVALADPGFRFVHVSLSTPAPAAGFPLARPLDDLVLIHRALDRGAFALRASASVRDGSALVIVGDPGRPDASGMRGSEEQWHGWLLLDPRDGEVRVCPLPSTVRTARTAHAWQTARLGGLHVLDALSECDEAVRVLDPDAAATELLRVAFAPMGACGSGERAVERALRIAAAVPVVHVRRGAGARFSWQTAPLAVRALPAGA